jgi:cell division protein FtsL
VIRDNKKRADGSRAGAGAGSVRRFSIRRLKTLSKTTLPRPRSANRPAEKAPASYLALICLVAAVVAGLFVFHLSIRFEGVRLGYETSQARAERARLLVERRELRLELATLKSPKRIETEARERLGMEIPDHNRIILMGKQTKTILASGGAR